MFVFLCVLGNVINSEERIDVKINRRILNRWYVDMCVLPVTLSLVLIHITFAHFKLKECVSAFMSWHERTEIYRFGSVLNMLTAVMTF